MRNFKMDNDMYGKLPNLILGFHGCDRDVFESVIHKNNELIGSKNAYDWLGNGIYFWEHNLERAWDWAYELEKRSKVKTPAVIGAVIDLGYCLNLLDSRYINIVKDHFVDFKKIMEALDKPLPQNKNSGDNTDLLLRNLDCAVIEDLHTTRKRGVEPAFDSVRGLFREGKEIYPTAGFYEKTHIQICVRNPNCIKGYFNPISANSSFAIP